MEYDIIFAGHGGQGVQAIGLILSHAALAEGKEILWRPEFEGKIRTGISTCIVSISDAAIWSPAVDFYHILAALDQFSLNTLEPKLKPGGLLLWECTNIKEPPSRTDIQIIALPAYQLATDEFDNIAVMNMIFLGALIKQIPLVKPESLISALPDALHSRYHQLIPLNEKAIRLGMGHAVHLPALISLSPSAASIK